MSSHECLVSEAASDEAADPGLPPAADLPLRFLRTSEKSWVHRFDGEDKVKSQIVEMPLLQFTSKIRLSTDIKFYENALEIELTEDGDVKLEQEAQLYSADHVDVPLLDMLRDARGFKIVPQGPSGAKGMELFGRLLEVEGNPLPTLDSLGIILSGHARTEVKYDIMPVICDAMKSGKLVKLTSFTFWDRDIFPRLDRGNNPYLALFEKGNLGCGLQLLDLSSYSGGEGGHMALKKAMESGRLPDLQTLNLAETGMGSADCKAYAKSMMSGNLSKLKSLNFRLNRIGDLGAAALSLARRSGKVNTLTYMDLSYNDIRDKGLVELVNSGNTGASSGLKSLILRGNRFTEEAFGFLSGVLASGQLDSLQTLDLTWCRNPKKDRFGNPILSTSSFAEALVVALAENAVLDCTIEFEWWYWPSLDRLRQQYHERNRKSVKMGPKVQATFGSVYFLGNPQAGKTTLRKSLQKSYWEFLGAWEGWLRREESRSGTEVSELFSKGKRGDQSVHLTLLDMAAQEYHMTNNLLLNQSFDSSKATTFVLVTRHHDPEVAQEELEHWLRFIASSCGENILSPRKVFVVLNCFGGDLQPSLAYFDDWKTWLVLQGTKFDGYLDVETEPFIIDVRKRSRVSKLKQRLISHTRKMLGNEAVPEICHTIQNNLKVFRQSTDEFPVMKWEDFVKKVQEKNSEWLEKDVEDATTYLNDAGILLYIHKEFLVNWGIPVKKLVILNPEWFCKDILSILSKMFNPDGNFKSSLVNTENGSFSVKKLAELFRSKTMHNKWKKTQVEDEVVANLICLGLSYVGPDVGQDVDQDGGQDQKYLMFTPNFIEESRTGGNSKWAPRKLPPEDVKGQWVMGYTVEEALKNPIILAPIGLWHRFQVELGRRPNFNATTRSDNNFLVGKYHITFKVNFMDVFISVDHRDSPTFHKIDIFVEPCFRVASDVIQDSNTRKECQVDLASDLVGILLDLWNQVCPGVGYVHRVVWPWPVYCSREIIPERNMEVAAVLKFVEENGCEIPMPWKVENDSIAWEQLLSKREFDYAVKSFQGNDYLHVVRELMREAVDLKILPQETSTSDESRSEEIRAGVNDSMTGVRQLVDELKCDQDVIMENREETKEVRDELKSDQDVILENHEETKEVRDELRCDQDVIMENHQKTKEVRNELKDVVRAKTDVLEKVENFGNFLLGDKERNCPRFVFLGLNKSGEWATLKKLKETISPMEKVHLHFLCEVQYENHGHHQVVDQEGLHVSRLKDWAEKLLPWLEASLMVLFISAKVAANVVDPSLSTVIPDFTTWHSIIRSITVAIGYSQQELDELSKDGMWAGINSTFKSPTEFRDLVREAMKEFLGDLTLSEVEKKLGLRKVHLHDGFFDGVAWICNDCYKKYDPTRIKNIIE